MGEKIILQCHSGAPTVSWGTHYYFLSSLLNQVASKADPTTLTSGKMTSKKNKNRQTQEGRFLLVMGSPSHISGSTVKLQTSPPVPQKFRLSSQSHEVVQKLGFFFLAGEMNYEH